MGSTNVLRMTGHVTCFLVYPQGTPSFLFEVRRRDGENGKAVEVLVATRLEKGWKPKTGLLRKFTLE